MMSSVRSIVTLFCLALIGSYSAVAHDDETDKAAKSFTVTKGGLLDVGVNVGTINVQTWDKNEVRVHYTVDEDEEDGGGVRVSQKGNTIMISTNSRWAGYNDIDFEISIPSQFNVNLETSAGDISISGNITGTVECQTSGGNISTGSVEGKLDLTTSGGDITTDDVKGDVMINTSGGNIRMGAITGVTDVHTSGGDIEIEQTNKKLIAETLGGNVHIGDIGGDALVKTSGGDIILDHVAGGATLKTAGGNIYLKSANGSVIAKTAGGDVHADSVVGSIDAKTSAGNIEVELIPSGTGKSKLSTSVGDVKLFIAENAKATITARNRTKYWGRGSDDEDVITSDFKEESYDRDDRGREVRATYILNGGGQSISIEASMGNIEILKSDAHARSSHSTKYKKKHKR